MKIESNIPPPSKDDSVTNVLRKMAINDSVVIARKKVTHWRATASGLNFKVSVRKIDNDSARLWKVA